MFIIFIQQMTIIKKIIKLFLILFVNNNHFDFLQIVEENVGNKQECYEIIVSLIYNNLKE